VRPCRVVIQPSVGAKSHAAQFAGVGEHIGKVLRFTVVSDVGRGPIGEGVADPTVEGSRFVTKDIDLQVLG
jgi:hypothetical protein